MTSPTGTPPQILERIATLNRFARSVRIALLLLAVAAWVLAYVLWRTGEGASALVVAIMGYVLIRSTRKITFNLAWRRFGSREGFRELLLALDEHFILGGETAMLAEYQRTADQHRAEDA